MPTQEQYLEEGIGFFSNLALGLFKPFEHSKKEIIETLLRKGGIPLLGKYAKAKEQEAITSGFFIVHHSYAYDYSGRSVPVESDLEAGIQFLLRQGFHFRSQEAEKLHIERLLRKGGLLAVGKHVCDARGSMSHLMIHFTPTTTSAVAPVQQYEFNRFKPNL